MQLDKTLDFYGYILNFAAVAPGNAPSASFTIDLDSDFYLQKLVQETDIAGAAVTTASEVIPLVTVQIQDGGSSRSLFSAPCPIHAVFGTGENPFILPAPRQFAAGASVTVSLVNYSAATTYNLRLAFLGIKKYKFGS